MNSARRASVALAALLLVAVTFACKSKNDAGVMGQTSGSAPAQSAAAPAAMPQVPPLSPAQIAEALRPPQGSKVAIQVFEDLQCPSCARNETDFEQAAKYYHIPIVRHDFLIPSHNWSPEAHVMARYFDSISPQLGEEFRRYIFSIQPTITKQNLREKADQFASQHGQQLPTFFDPSGAFKAKVDADTKLGLGIGVHQTPTVYISRVRPDGSVDYVELQKIEDLMPTLAQAVQMEKQESASAPAAKKRGQ
ncbi:MAG TPA: thioredoxin domain-containing protein [Candidatus Acidoferrales bacterium]|nr:thioredoxin domain-containing protein [Candidatus Acidoferrales bacterium]